MHAAATSIVFVSLLGQIGGGYSGGYSNSTADDAYGEAITVTSEAPRTRATSRGTTRAVRAPSSNPLTDSYPRARVATSPRYASEASTESSLPPVGNSNRIAQEDPQSVLADKLLRDLVNSTRAEQNVQSLKLIDALERTSGSQQQFTAIKAYWDWALSVNELYGVVEEDDILARLAVLRNSSNTDKAAHQAQRSASQSRLEDSRLDVAAKVADLLEATGLRTTNTLRPSDVPFVGVYNTNFSKIFPGNSAPITLKKIHQTLPFALKVIRSRADSYQSSRAAVTAAVTDYQANKIPYNDFSDALAQMRSQRRAFLDSVHDYNFAIAEYALSIAGPGLERQTVVSMLIRTTSTRGPYRGASLETPRDVLPVSGVEEIEPFYSRRISPEDEAPVLPPPGLDDQPVRRQLHSVMVR